jgi:hypothetical protein
MTLTLVQNNIISHLLKLEGNNLAKCMNLLNYFIEEFPEAPGSSHNHQSYPGGYYKHINDILNYAKKMYKELSKMGKLEFKFSDAILVLFLHDIEKPVKYCIGAEESDSEIRKRLIVEYNIELNDEHVNALRYIHGEGDDYCKDKRVMSPLCAFCHCCDVIIARIFYK